MHRLIDSGADKWVYNI